MLQLRNRLSRQKRIRDLNQRSLKSGENRADKVEGLLMEMQSDLRSLKERLQVELNDLGMLSSADIFVRISFQVAQFPCHFRFAGLDKSDYTKNPTESENSNNPTSNSHLPDSQGLKVDEAPVMNEQSAILQGAASEPTVSDAINEKRRLDIGDGDDHENKRARLE